MADGKREVITSPKQIAKKYKVNFEKWFNNNFLIHKLNNSTVDNKESNGKNTVHYTIEAKGKTMNWNEI